MPTYKGHNQKFFGGNFQFFFCKIKGNFLDTFLSMLENGGNFSDEEIICPSISSVLLDSHFFVKLWFISSLFTKCLNK